MHRGWISVVRLTVAALLTALVVGAAGTAGAQEPVEPYVGSSPTVAGETVDRAPAPQAASGESGTSSASGQTSQASAAQSDSSDLAFTGRNVTMILVVGLLALVAGSVLLVTRRRNAAA